MGEGLMEMKISAIILDGGNLDQALLAKCLKSVAWVNEIIRVRTDGKKKDFAQWRNEGAAKARGEWLFYIDSDEEVSPKLKEEIKRVILEGSFSAYAIPRRNILLGHPMYFGGWWPDYVLRLIKKTSLVKWEGDLHEQPKIRGGVGKLKNPLLHTSHRTLSEMVDKTNAWSEIEARLLFTANHPQMHWWRFFSVAAREFWQRGIVKLGFLDGPVGVIEIGYQIFSRMVTYAKLWELQEGQEK